MAQALQYETMSTQRYPWRPGEGPPTQVESFGASASGRGHGTIEAVLTTAADILRTMGLAVSPREPSDGTFVAGFSRDVRSLVTPEIEGTRQPSREDKLYAELQSYRALEHGWDGYEGVPASLDALMDAFGFLSKRPPDIPLPYPEISPDAEVGLYWRTEEVFAEVGFYGDGEYSYYARYTPRVGEPIEHGEDGCSVDAEWHTDLMLVLNKIAK